ncbi:hypothetical protein THAOC_29837, partial [Thalassiosira oceanica]
LGVFRKIPPAGPRGRNGLLDGGLRHGRPVVQRVQLRGGRAGRRDARRVPAVSVESRGGLAGHQVHGQHRKELAALREGLHHDADTAERHWVQRLLATAVVRRAVSVLRLFSALLLNELIHEWTAAASTKKVWD